MSKKRSAVLLAIVTINWIVSTSPATGEKTTEQKSQHQKVAKAVAKPSPPAGGATNEDENQGAGKIVVVEDGGRKDEEIEHLRQAISLGELARLIIVLVAVGFLWYVLTKKVNEIKKQPDQSGDLAALKTKTETAATMLAQIKADVQQLGANLAILQKNADFLLSSVERLAPILPPEILLIEPASAPAGTEVVVFGSHFAPGSNVWFGTARLAVTVDPGGNNFHVTVPAKPASEVNVIVTGRNGVSTPHTFKITSK